MRDACASSGASAGKQGHHAIERFASTLGREDRTLEVILHCCRPTTVGATHPSELDQVVCITRVLNVLTALVRRPRPRRARGGGKGRQRSQRRWARTADASTWVSTWAREGESESERERQRERQRARESERERERARERERERAREREREL